MHPNKGPFPPVPVQAKAHVKAKVKATVMIRECIVLMHPCTKLSKVRFQEYIESLHSLVRLAQ